MSGRKTIATATLSGAYGPDTVRIEHLKQGRHAGRYVTRGAGYAGRVAYASEARCRVIVEGDRRFMGWVA